jgi:branched-chain amino acid transport system substrate-binding protein
MKIALRHMVGLVGAAMVFAGCGGTADGGSEEGGAYVLGAMLPLTGPAATVGQDFLTGMEMAVEEINAAGGIDGEDIVLKSEDTQGTPEGGVEAINKFVNLEKTPMVLTATSAQTLSAQPIAAQRSTLLLNVGGASPNLLDLPFLYNNAVNVNAMGPILAEYLHEEGYERLAFIGVADPFGEGTVDAVTPVWEELGGTVVENQSVDALATDYSGQLLKIRSADPDVVVASATGETLGQIVQQARAAGIDVPMAGPLGTAGLTAVAGPAAEGFIDVSMTVADPAEAPDSPAAQFYEDYQERYDDKVPSWIPGTAYETVYLYKTLVEQAIENGDDPRDGAVLEELIGGATFDDRLMGDAEVRFLDDHSVGRMIAIRQVTDGDFAVLELVEASAAE